MPGTGEGGVIKAALLGSNAEHRGTPAWRREGVKARCIKRGCVGRGEMGQPEGKGQRAERREQNAFVRNTK